LKQDQQFSIDFFYFIANSFQFHIFTSTQ